MSFWQTSDLADPVLPPLKHNQLWILNVNSEQIKDTDRMTEVLNGGQVGNNYYFLQFSLNYEDTDGLRMCLKTPWNPL